MLGLQNASFKITTEAGLFNWAAVGVVEMGTWLRVVAYHDPSWPYIYIYNIYIYTVCHSCSRYILPSHLLPEMFESAHDSICLYSGTAVAAASANTAAPPFSQDTPKRPLNFPGMLTW